MCYRSKQVSSLRNIAQQYSDFVRDAQDSQVHLPQTSEWKKSEKPEELTLKSLLQFQNDTHPQRTDSSKQHPKYFKRVYVSNLACIKILQHSLEGGDIEIMGMLVGTVCEDSIIVYDCFSLPVEGTETRVNAQLESYEYMVQYMSEIIENGSNTRNIVGWYHSHPGYGCWLSGTDVQTQELNQKFQDPYVAIVVDPKKSRLDENLHIGAFRTLPQLTEEEQIIEGEEVRNEGNISKYGRHSSRYYELESVIFRSEYDKAFNHISLRQDVPEVNCAEEPVLFEQFLESVRNWNNFKRIMGTNDFLPRISRHARCDNEEDDYDGQIEMGRATTSSHRTSRANSVTSAVTMDNGSDVDMDITDFAENGSGGSSVSTMMLDRVPIITEHELQEDMLKREYYVLKKKLELLKLEEYERLKFYKDAFTL